MHCVLHMYVCDTHTQKHVLTDMRSYPQYYCCMVLTCVNIRSYFFVILKLTPSCEKEL